MPTNPPDHIYYTTINFENHLYYIWEIFSLVDLTLLSLVMLTASVHPWQGITSQVAQSPLSDRSSDLQGSSLDVATGERARPPLRHHRKVGFQTLRYSAIMLVYTKSRLSTGQTSLPNSECPFVGRQACEHPATTRSREAVSTGAPT